MAIELFTNLASTTVSTGGATTPSSGSTETWTVASSATFPAASSSAPASQFHITDPANNTEIIKVTNISGTTWTVTRGDESTTTVSHLSGFTIQQVISEGFLNKIGSFLGDQVPVTPPVTLANSTTETALASLQVPASEPTSGTCYHLKAYGRYSTTGTPTLTWNLRWGGTSGTSLISLAPTVGTGVTNCLFSVEGMVNFASATTAYGELVIRLATSATQTTAVNTYLAQPTSVSGTLTVTPSQLLVLTALWGSASASDTLTVQGGFARRVAPSSVG